MDIYNKQLGLVLPELPGVDQVGRHETAETIRFAMSEWPKNGAWLALDHPEDLCVVVMATGRMFDHVGVWMAVDGGLVLHTRRNAGCLAQSRPALASLGIRRLMFYRYGAYS